ncbi:hypothetical protein PAPHI01_0226 [Pancytospora philotis]|nr:hypothetical protein PAPHI01_0226 [Pancytospora philotis]
MPTVISHGIFEPMASTKEIGIVTVTTGCAIFFFGVLAMFDSALMIAGNLLVIAGTAMLLRSRSLSLLECDKLFGTFLFGLGVIALFLRLCMVGFLLELFGLVYVFKKSIPSFRSVLLRLFFAKSLNKSS